MTVPYKQTNKQTTNKLYHCSVYLTLHSFSLKLCSAIIDLKYSALHCTLTLHCSYSTLNTLVMQSHRVKLALHYRRDYSACAGHQFKSPDNSPSQPKRTRGKRKTSTENWPNSSFSSMWQNLKKKTDILREGYN